MILPSLLAFAPLLSPSVEPATLVPSESGPFVIKARRVEIGNGEVMEHAVMLVQDGRIVTMGQDLPIERGLPVVELAEDQVVMPGIVDPYSRYGMSGGGFNDSRPNIMASEELYPSTRYDAFLENGITTVAQYPAGWLADKFDRRWVLIWLSGAAILSCGVSMMSAGLGTLGIMLAAG
ncbi:MAG: hypothetical protein AAFP86_11815, partial [Planctomycetota bacterium]